MSASIPLTLWAVRRAHGSAIDLLNRFQPYLVNGLAKGTLAGP